MAADSCMIYADSLEHEAVFAYRLNLESGALQPVGEPVELAMPWAMALHPSRRTLYAIDHFNHALASIAIDPDSGALRLLDSCALPAKLGLLDPSYIHIDPSGRHLLTCDYWTDRIGCIEIADDGRLQPETIATVSVGSGLRGSRADRQHPHSIRLDPQANYVIVPFTGKDRIEFYKWRDGRIVSPSVAYFETVGGTGPRHSAVHPTRPWLYFNNERGTLKSKVTQYELLPGQPQVEEKGTWSTLPDGCDVYNAIADVHVTPCGRFLYVSNRGHDSIAGFAISQANGSLEALGQFPTGQTPTAFAIDPSGRFLIASSLGDGTLSVHRIDATTGTLAAPTVSRCEWYGPAPKRTPHSSTRAGEHEPSSGEKYVRGKPAGTPWVLAR